MNGKIFENTISTNIVKSFYIHEKKIELIENYMIIHILNAICTAVHISLSPFVLKDVYMFFFLHKSSTPFVKTINLQIQQKGKGNKQIGYQNFTHKQMVSFGVSLGTGKALDRSSAPL